MNRAESDVNNNTCNTCLMPLSEEPEDIPGSASYKGVVVTRCQHTMHAKCIGVWLDMQSDHTSVANRQCSFCRQPAVPLFALNRNSNEPCEFKSEYGEKWPLSVCRRGKLDVLQKTLQENPGMVKQTFYSEALGEDTSLLMYAASMGYTNIAQLLIRMGGEVNKRHNNGETPLTQAVNKGHHYLARELIRAGGKFNILLPEQLETFKTALKNKHRYVFDGLVPDDSNGDALKNMLLEAVINIRPNEVPMLMEKVDRVDFSYAGTGGYTSTPLHTAVWVGEETTVSILAQKVKNFDAIDGSGRTALQLAVSKGFSMVQIFDKFPANKKNLTGALRLAANNPDERIFNLLFEKLKKIDGEYSLDSVIFEAARSNNIKVVQTLCKEVSPDTVNYVEPQYEFSTLTTAVFEKNVKIVEALLSIKGKEGANFNIQQSSGQSQRTMRLACQKGNLEIVELLVKSGFSVNSPSGTDFPPLYNAAQSGNVSLVDFLLRNGAEIDIQCINDSTALIFSARHGIPGVVERLLKAGANHKLQTADGNTALHVASREGHLEVVEKLLRANADHSLKNKDECTALHLAAERGHTEVVKWLLEAGADCELKDKGGNTALHIASVKGNTEIVDQLLARGAGRYHRNGGGATALELACARGHKEVMEKFQDHGSYFMETLV